MIGFYVSGNATRLQKYLVAIKNKPEFLHRIKFILIDTKTNEALRNLAKELKIRYVEIAYRELNLSGQARNQYISELFLALLKETNCKNGFIWGGKILVGNLLIEYANKLVNFHPSLLPAHKGGTRAIDEAISEHTFLLGNTAHFIDEGVDTGAVIMQSIFPSALFSGNYDAVLDQQLPMVHQIIEWFESNRIAVIDQKVVIKNANYEVSEFVPCLEIDLKMFYKI